MQTKGDCSVGTWVEIISLRHLDSSIDLLLDLSYGFTSLTNDGTGCHTGNQHLKVYTPICRQEQIRDQIVQLETG